MLLFDWIACPSWHPATSVKALSGTENRVTNSSLNSYFILVWLSIWSKVQTCIWPSWCHCHSLSCASVKSTLVLPSMVLAHLGSPGNVCVCVCVCVASAGPHTNNLCTSLQRDNHTNTSSLSFYRLDALPAAQPTVSKHWRQTTIHW